MRSGVAPVSDSHQVVAAVCVPMMGQVVMKRTVGRLQQSNDLAQRRHRRCFLLVSRVFTPK